MSGFPSLGSALDKASREVSKWCVFFFAHQLPALAECIFLENVECIDVFSVSAVDQQSKYCKFVIKIYLDIQLIKFNSNLVYWTTFYIFFLSSTLKQSWNIATTTRHSFDTRKLCKQTSGRSKALIVGHRWTSKYVFPLLFWLRTIKETNKIRKSMNFDLGIESLPTKKQGGTFCPHLDML